MQFGLSSGGTNDKVLEYQSFKHFTTVKVGGINNRVVRLSLSTVVSTIESRQETRQESNRAVRLPFAVKNASYSQAQHGN